MREIVECLLEKNGAIAEYRGDKGSIYVSGSANKVDPFGEAEGITAKVKINITWIYNESNIPSSIQPFSAIRGNISELTIYDAVLESLLGKNDAEKTRNCLNGHTLDGYRSLQMCDIYVKKLEEYAKKQSFEAIIKGVQFIIVIPSVTSYVENKTSYIKNYILKNVHFVAKDIERIDLPSALR